jgi:hypothetical protein
MKKNKYFVIAIMLLASTSSVVFSNNCNLIAGASPEDLADCLIHQMQKELQGTPLKTTMDPHKKEMLIDRITRALPLSFSSRDQHEFGFMAQWIHELLIESLVKNEKDEENLRYHRARRQMIEEALTQYHLLQKPLFYDKLKKILSKKQEYLGRDFDTLVLFFASYLSEMQDAFPAQKEKITQDFLEIFKSHFKKNPEEISSLIPEALALIQDLEMSQQLEEDRMNLISFRDYV